MAEMARNVVSEQRGAELLDERRDGLLRERRKTTLIECVLGESECGRVVPLALLHEDRRRLPGRRQGPALQGPIPGDQNKRKGSKD